MHLSHEKVFFTAYQRLSNKHMTLTLIQWFSSVVVLFFHCMGMLLRVRKNWIVSSNHLGSDAENSTPHRRFFWTFFFLVLQNLLASRSSLRSSFLLWACYNFSNKSCGSAAVLRERNMLGCSGTGRSYSLLFMNSSKYADLENLQTEVWHTFQILPMDTRPEATHEFFSLNKKHEIEHG